MSTGESEIILHANSVAVDGRALLITGPSGAGKSDLTLALMALGAGLIADDRTRVARQSNGPPIASAPEAIRGMIEARYIGLLRVVPATPSPVAAILDLGQMETERLPEPRTTLLLGASLPLLHKSEMPNFAAGLIQFLKHGLIHS